MAKLREIIKIIQKHEKNNDAEAKDSKDFKKEALGKSARA